jgi:hypothetical protein
MNVFPAPVSTTQRNVGSVLQSGNRSLKRLGGVNVERIEDVGTIEGNGGDPAFGIE